MQKLSSNGGGIIVGSVFLLVVAVLGFVLGYTIGVQRGEKRAVNGMADMTVEEILRRNLQKDTGVQVTPKQFEFYKKLAQASKQAAKTVAEEFKSDSTPQLTVVRESSKEQKTADNATQHSVIASKFTIQVGSFKEKAKAEAFAADLRERGFDAYVGDTKANGSSTWYRVRVGRFQEKQEAVQVVAQVKECQRQKCFVASYE